jgi:hypothetical protein
MVCPAIDNLASCEIRTVIRSLYTKNMSVVETHRELCAVYFHVMSIGALRQWCTMFKDGRTNVHDEEQSGRPFVVSDDLVQNVDQKFVKDGASQFQNFLANFQKCYALFSTRLSQSG